MKRILLLLLASCTFPALLALGPSKDGLLMTGPNECLYLHNGTPARLRPNPLASNPSFAKLSTFLRADKIHERAYVDGKYVCAEFALDLYNSAEKSGLRAAYVVVWFEQGPSHAFNAFETTDRGLVYVDCTGTRDSKDAARCVKVVYLEKGKPLGLLPLRLARADLSSYAFYAKTAERSAGLVAWHERIRMEAEALLAEGGALMSDHERLDALPAKAALDYDRRAREHNSRAAAFRASQDKLLSEAHRVGDLITLANTSPLREIKVWW